jgi:uncharacterized protein DUF3800
VDESGIPLQRTYSHYFCLGAVIISDRYWRNIESEIINLKTRHKIREIHTRDIYKMEKEFSYLVQSPEKRLVTLGDVFSMISRLDVVLISSVINKHIYYIKYTDDAVEYRAWKHLFERCDMGINDMCKARENVENGLIIIDHHSDPAHDQQIRNYLLVMRSLGFGFHTFDHMIEVPLFTPSIWTNVIQLADAVAYCTTMYLLKDNFFVKQFLTIRDKFRKGPNGDIDSYGLKVFPT